MNMKIRKRILLISLFTSLICLSGMGKGEKLMEPEDLDFISVGKGIISDNADYNTMGQPCFFAVTSRESWLALKHLFSFLSWADGYNADFPEKIDFKTHTLLIFTPGVMGSTGNDIELTKIQLSDTLNFYMTQKIPEGLAAMGAALTHPFHMVLIKKIVLPENPVFYINGEVRTFKMIIK